MDDPISNSLKEHGKNCMEWRITDELLRGKMFAQKTDIENYFSKCSFGKFVCSVNKTIDLLFFVYFVVVLVSFVRLVICVKLFSRSST